MQHRQQAGLPDHRNSVHTPMSGVDLASERPHDMHQPMDIDDDDVVLDLTSPDVHLAGSFAAPPLQKDGPAPMVIDIDEDMDGLYGTPDSISQARTKQITPASTSLPPPLPSQLPTSLINHPRLDILKILQDRHSEAWIREVGSTVRKARKFHAKHRREIPQVSSGHSEKGRNDERAKWKPGVVGIL
jgi:hypothetical protein